MGAGLIFGLIAGYFLLLLVVAWFTGKESRDDMFFLAGRKSPWFVVAFGMIGASLSGVTFISIPGVVGAGGANMAFSYMQLVFGYLLGYAVIAFVLLPTYYKLQLTSIYTYLERRFGYFSYKTGAAFFLFSRTIGAAFRLYLVAMVLHQFVLQQFGISFALSVAVSILLIWVYTFRGGIRTIVWTDTLQTVCMLTAVGFTVYFICQSLGIGGVGDLTSSIQNSGYGQVFFFEDGWSNPNHFLKQFLSGALITIVMTGLDQDMMQKNLSCRSLKDAQKNMLVFSVILVFANLLFLTLGALLYIYAGSIGLDIPEKTDQLFPLIALDHLSPIVGIMFVLGLIAAAYSSADSALTSLTTSFCVDFLNFEKRPSSPELKRTRFIVHLGFSVLLFAVILFFNILNDDAVINSLFRAAGYTYGPLLGLYTFGLFTSSSLRDKWVMPICIASPIITYFLDYTLRTKLDFNLGFTILAVNGMITFFGLLAISFRPFPTDEIA